MKTILLLCLVLLAGCETLTNKDVEFIRAIYSEAGGLSAAVTGKVSSCTIIQSKGSAPAKVKSMVSGDGKCEVELGR